MTFLVENLIDIFGRMKNYIFSRRAKNDISTQNAKKWHFYSKVKSGHF